ncbi:MAG TPA: CinA family protein [Planctomycetaceae bacterium]|nr:CinA family protein [Planctomycetaceae bacterium]HQZ68005.1 CinA family protein [Planctomycetaceae bacterium]
MNTTRKMLDPQKFLDSLAEKVFSELESLGAVVVFAESCTAGLIAATLARVPGMSRRLAGSFVVYQVDSKVAWLEIDPELIQRHDVVSREVAEAMAAKALEHTPHATIALGITGHLGPDAPPALDGTAWMAIAKRGGDVVATKLSLKPESEPDPQSMRAAIRIRRDRQQDAVCQALFALLESCDRSM